jgi:hypothetical protein
MAESVPFDFMSFYRYRYIYGYLISLSFRKINSTRNGLRLKRRTLLENARNVRN